MNSKILNLLGLANRAGFIVTGEESVELALSRQKLKIVFVANDASSRTVDKFVKKCYFYKVVCSLDFSSEELSSALGKFRKIVGLTDQGFYVALEKLMR
jgi:ribosomal protein L7Ae-like RNA K-turn-binding protein